MESLRALAHHLPGWVLLAALAAGVATACIRDARGYPSPVEYGVGIASIVAGVLVVLVAIGRTIES